jgi:hypothetical protein
MKPRKFEGFNKVFCLGWLKTGSTSLGDAMRRLGFKHCGWDVDIWREWRQNGNIRETIQFAKNFESFDDLPWNHTGLLEHLDKAFPESKFILLERDGESWFRSMQIHRIERHEAPMVDKEFEIKKFAGHNDFVKQYFCGEKQSQLLVMNVIEGDGYERLCPHLGLPVLDEPFPHSNRAK